MPVPAPPPLHRAIAVDAHRVPAPFRSLAVRSDEASHADRARAPYGRVHLLRSEGFLDPASRQRLAEYSRARVPELEALDVTHAATGWPELAAASGVGDLAGGIGAALQRTGVPGLDARATAGRVDHLVCRGAGFHNDVARHWPRCLFWVLALALDDAAFVMPHAALCLPLAPGDLLLFDPSMAHGLGRPADGGRVRADAFGPEPVDLQRFLTGELLLNDAQWAALGAPWLPVEWHHEHDALDLRVASFDERSGAIQRVSALRGCMLRAAAGPAAAG